jgi:A/G-specific adenine glycosylase
MVRACGAFPLQSVPQACARQPHGAVTRSGHVRTLPSPHSRESGVREDFGASDMSKPELVTRPLLRWYARARRDLPWRGSRDPYHVWVSEIMLQQTQVERVRDYFTRFLARFPTVRALARAREADVLKRWEGLGYYRRARQLHAAARAIVRDHGGEFPQTVAGLLTLPGIGRYTAGAIASIAFGVRAPIVEANSRRVLARLVGHAAAGGGPAGDGSLWEVAARLVPAREPGLFNQALMDLGAGVCTPQRPLCDRCPLAGTCVALRDGRVAEIPAVIPRRAAKVVRETAVVERRGDRVLVERRGPGEWWEGLWDFPRAARRPGDRRLGSVAYTVTHHNVTCAVVERIGRGRPPRSTAIRRWVTPRTPARLPLSAPGRRIARLIEAATAQAAPRRN